MAADAHGKKRRRLARLEARTSDAPAARNVLLSVASFLRVEERSATPLLVAALVALVWVNSPWSEAYQALWEAEIGISLGPFAFQESLRHLVNELLMPIFFFVIGMEVKQELLEGELSSVQRASFPLAAAVGGVVVPALVFVAITWGSDAMSGWGIPVATDIAFALAILALLGDAIPAALKVLTLAFATLDDIAGVLIIAFFYSAELSLPALGATALVFAAMLLLSRFRLRSTAVFLLLGLCLWACVVLSGVHATIAGVLLGTLVPTRAGIGGQEFGDEAAAILEEFQQLQERQAALRARTDPTDAEVEELRATHGRIEALLGELEEQVSRVEAPTERLAERVNPWVSYAVLPIFALANAGVELSPSVLSEAAVSPLSWAVGAGLLLGKPLGILLFSWGAVRLRLARAPENVSWRHVVGMGLVAAIGFTVSLFIDQLAFAGDASSLQNAKIGILLASLIAGIAGFAWLAWSGSGPGEDGADGQA